MPISKRVLTKWRKESLRRILDLTQELIDQELIKETKDANHQL